jgi:hypothetical protein
MAQDRVRTGVRVLRATVCDLRMKSTSFLVLTGLALTTHYPLFCPQQSRANVSRTAAWRFVTLEHSVKGSGSSTDAGPWHDRRMSATSTLRTQSRVSASRRWGLNQPVHHAIDDTRPIGLLAFRQGGRVKRLVRASGGSVNWCRSEPCSTSIGGSRVKRSPSRGQRTRDGGAAHRETNLLQPGVSRDRAQLVSGGCKTDSCGG